MNIQINISGIASNALVDTGAATNMMSKSLANRMPQGIRPESRVIVGLGNHEVNTVGIITCDFAFYGVKGAV